MRSARPARQALRPAIVYPNAEGVQLVACRQWGYGELANPPQSGALSAAGTA